MAITQGALYGRAHHAVNDTPIIPSNEFVQYHWSSTSTIESPSGCYSTVIMSTSPSAAPHNLSPSSPVWRACRSALDSRRPGFKREPNRCLKEIRTRIVSRSFQGTLKYHLKRPGGEDDSPLRTLGTEGYRKPNFLRLFFCHDGEVERFDQTLVDLSRR
jgi:hypothetical protein